MPSVPAKVPGWLLWITMPMQPAFIAASVLAAKVMFAPRLTTAILPAQSTVENSVGEPKPANTAGAVRPSLGVVAANAIGMLPSSRPASLSTVRWMRYALLGLAEHHFGIGSGELGWLTRGRADPRPLPSEAPGREARDKARHWPFLSSQAGDCREVDASARSFVMSRSQAT